MRYGSVCSGIEAATMGWHDLDWEPAFFSDIDPFPRAVLSHHYPDVPLHGDFTTIGEHDYGSIDLLVGGTPCQSFSVAGLRGGMDDDRGNLALEYLKLAQRKRPKWLVWENVPGVLSSNGGRDFGAFLGGLVELGYGFAYRICDAQYFGVAQRRRRVFVVGYLGDWRRAAAVLFERESLSGHSAPSRETREEIAGTVTTRSGSGGGGGLGTDEACGGFLQATKSIPDVCPTLGTELAKQVNNQMVRNAEAFYHPIAFGAQNSASQGDSVSEHVTPTLDKSKTPAVAQASAVRRLTPTECERLQGFPDNYTQIPYRNKPADKCPDGPRYKAMGNSMAVPVMRWIGERINMVNSIGEKL